VTCGLEEGEGEVLAGYVNRASQAAKSLRINAANAAPMN
jgi:hypothetical protein